MLNQSLVEPSNSLWNSPVVSVKKSLEQFRPYCGYRTLNDLTKRDGYPLHRIVQIVNLSSRTWSSVCITCLWSSDVQKAFWQIPEEHFCEQTSIILGKGLFQFTVVAFCLCNSTQTQQRLCDSLLGANHEPNILTYLNNVS